MRKGTVWEGEWRFRLLQERTSVLFLGMDFGGKYCLGISYERTMYFIFREGNGDLFQKRMN